MIYIFLAEGFEEIEALTVADILRRTDITVKLVGVGNKKILGAHEIAVLSDIEQSEVTLENLDGIVLPGGLAGRNNLEASATVKNAIKFCFENDLLLAAICAAPSILGHMGLLNGKSVTCYPGFEKELGAANFLGGNVCEDGNIITAKGPAASLDFALTIVKYLQGTALTEKIKAQMQCI